MPLVIQTILLFALNVIDAVLTLYWVRHGYATEGNHLMATLLDLGDLPFLAIKISIGAVTAGVLWRWRDFKLAKYGLVLTLSLYFLIMGVHFMTGLTAFGVVSDHFIQEFAGWTREILS
jgi:hypothetical protein